MKWMDRNGRIFEKISILDLLAVFVLIVLIFFASLKIRNKDISQVREGDAEKTLKWVVEVEGRKGLSETIKIGDRLGDMKQYLNARVVSVSTENVVEVNWSVDGRKVESVHPLKERILVEVEGTLPYQSYSYKLGKQEIRYGQSIFLESDAYRMAGKVISIEVEQ